MLQDEDPMEGSNRKMEQERLTQKGLQSAMNKDKDAKTRRNIIRKNSISLLVPEATTIPSLMDLTQQDFEVNAPVNCLLLQGEDLLTALEVTSGSMQLGLCTAVVRREFEIPLIVLNGDRARTKYVKIYVNKDETDDC